MTYPTYHPSAPNADEYPLSGEHTDDHGNRILFAATDAALVYIVPTWGEVRRFSSHRLIVERWDQLSIDRPLGNLAMSSIALRNRFINEHERGDEDLYRLFEELEAESSNSDQVARTCATPWKLRP